MKITKRISALLLCLCLIPVLLLPTASAVKYSPWFDTYYREMKQSLGIFPSGFEALDLAIPLSRREMCLVSIFMLEKITGNKIEPEREDYFTDTNEASILKAYEHGIVNGYEDGTFQPDKPISRQEFFVVVENFCGAAALSWNGTQALDDFDDRDSVSSWASGATQFCVHYKYVEGQKTGGKLYLKPKDTITRQEALKILLFCYKGLDEYYKMAVKEARVVSVSKTEGTTMVVTAEKLNVRSAPGTNATVLGSLLKNQTVTVTGTCDNGWKQILFGGKAAYVSGEYLTTPTEEDPGTPAEIPVQDPPQVSTLGESLANQALAFVGYPYIYGAASPSAGFDCSGLVYYVYNQNGLKMNRVADDQMNQGVPVSKDELTAGDLVFFGSGDYANHVGIYIGGGNFVHASTPASGVRISSLDENYYVSRYIGARRVAG